MKENLTMSVLWNLRTCRMIFAPLVPVLTAHNNDDLLVQQALKFKPNIVVIGDEKKYAKVKEALATTDVKVFAGEKSLDEVAAMDCFDLMLAAIVGYAGLRPTLKAIGN